MIPRSMGTAMNHNRVVAMSTATTATTTWSQFPHPHGYMRTCSCGGIQSEDLFAVFYALVFRGLNTSKPTSSSRTTLTYLSRTQFGQPTSSAAQAIRIVPPTSKNWRSSLKDRPLPVCVDFSTHYTSLVGRY